MYLNFYGLKEKPFQLLPDPSYFFLSSKHKTALNYLEYGILNNVGFIVITGEIGSGKTTLIKKFLSQLEKKIITAVISNTNVESKEFLQMLLQELGIEYSKEETKADLLNHLHHFLIEKYASRQQVVLIVDEAQNLPSAVLEEIRMISNLQTEKEFLIQIILVGQPPLREKLLHPSLEQFLQRVSLSYHLFPLNEQETKDYIKHRLKLAGARYPIFSEEALKAVFKHSQGVPRIINTLCEAALVYGFADERREIGAEIIETIIEELYPYRLKQPEEKQPSLWTTESPTTVMKESDGPSLHDMEKRLTNLENTVYNLQRKEIFLLYKIISLLEMIRTERQESDFPIDLQKIHNQIQKIYQLEKEVAEIKKAIKKE
ncbi:ATPase AAA [Candidatus Desulfofervidus auxilii]|uniref:ATPase AAA n=1 Tax=Desulfofervidus auxilii TaxID=1621989 RepID=A0A7U4THB6_DESA2|nr:AAA family ATPase [Candidatus Desulfofervidus auxilii]AMM41684.1 ATPase AAA [Candidatus Desulfofervidus auxilii]